MSAALRSVFPGVTPPPPSGMLALADADRLSAEMSAAGLGSVRYSRWRLAQTVPSGRASQRRPRLHRDLGASVPRWLSCGNRNVRRRTAMLSVDLGELSPRHPDDNVSPAERYVTGLAIQ